jgi:hypothetical protein
LPSDDPATGFGPAVHRPIEIVEATIIAAKPVDFEMFISKSSYIS